jgi:hypothetical protein
MPADGTLTACPHARTSARPASKAVLKASRFRGREEYGSASQLGQNRQCSGRAQDFRFAPKTRHPRVNEYTAYSRPQLLANAAIAASRLANEDKCEYRYRCDQQDGEDDGPYQRRKTGRHVVMVCHGE